MKTRIVGLIYALAGLPSALSRRVRNLGRETVEACNAFTMSRHHESINKTTANAITSRWLLGKSSGAGGVVVCGLGDRAEYVISDEISAARLSDLGGTYNIACLLLGNQERTVPMVAAGALNPGDVVYPVANGQVNTYVGRGSTGTNYPCGIVVAQPSTQAGDIVEVQPFLGINSSTN